MSTKQLLIFASIVFSIGVLAALVSLGFFNKPQNSSGPTIEQALQSASDQAVGSQNLTETAKNIVQSGITTNTTIVTNIPETNLSEFEEYSTFASFAKEGLVDKYKVDTLLDGSTVYSLSREEINLLGLDSRFYNLSQDPTLCENRCTLIKTKTGYLIGDLSIYYLSSFAVNGKIYWIGFIKDKEGYTIAQISEPYFKNAQVDNFTGQNITKINQKGPNSSEFVFDIQGNKSIEVDFKFSRSLPVEGFINGEPIGDD
jgi:hypothetical protein